MSLYQPVAVEESCLVNIEHYLLLLVIHVGHHSKGHPPSPQLLGFATTTQVGHVVACVGVGEATAMGVEDGIEAGDKHVWWDASQQRLDA